MLRAVNYCTLEIRQPDSPYFDRAICFVKPEYSQNGHLDLHRAAKHLIAEFDACIDSDTELNQLDMECQDTPQRHTNFLTLARNILPLALSAIIGSGLTLLIMLLF